MWAGQLPRRRFFLARATQQVVRGPGISDWLGGAAMLAAIASWGMLAFLLLP
jgi:hypothetical protein